VVLRLADGRRVKVGAGKSRKRNRVSAAGSVTLNIQGLKVGQIVLITQTADAAGNVTITVKLTQAPDANGGEDQDAAGTVTAVAADGSTLTIQTGDGRSLTFQTDSDMVDGISVGDTVDVAYYQDSDGSLVADDISPADNSGDSSGDDQAATGTVTGIAADSSTLTVAVDGGGSMTFQVDSDMVDGISVGDTVDVAYYQDSDGSFVADDVSPVDTSLGDEG
jgi:predicted RNA-binding protein (virulence factor B family)